MYDAFSDRRWRGLALAAYVVLSGCSGTETGPPAEGVVVVSLQEEGTAWKAGLREGDHLLSWTREAAPPHHPKSEKGAFATPFDLTFVEMEECPRGPITLAGRREGQPFSAKVAPGKWKIEARPVLSPTEVRAWEGAVEAAGTDDGSQGMEGFRTLAETLAGRGRKSLAAWALHEGAKRLSASKQWDSASGLYGSAIKRIDNSGDATGAAVLRTLAGEALMNGSLYDEAEVLLVEALERFGGKDSDSPAAGRLCALLGNLEFYRGDLEAAVTRFLEALANGERCAPGSVNEAMPCRALGVVHRRLGNLEASERYQRRAIAILEALSPGSQDLAYAINNLGVVLRSMGDYRGAEESYRSSLKIFESLDPGGRGSGFCLNNLGALTCLRGDLAAAEDYYRRALAIRERLDPGSEDVAMTLGNLGNVEGQRGDADRAEAYYRRALEIHERINPEGSAVALVLNNLGTCHLDRGDWAEAKAVFRQALERWRKIAPDGLDTADTWINLGNAEWRLGNLSAARQNAQKALALKEEKAPGSVSVSSVLHLIGSIAMQEKRYEEAEAAYRRALAIRTVMTPGSWEEADTTHSLGVLLHRSDRLEESLDTLTRAVDLLEGLQGRLGGTAEQRQSFRGRYIQYYRSLMDVQMELGRQREAFETLERSRARGFLALLAERDLAFDADIPADLERRRRLANAAFDRVQTTLAGLSPEKDRETLVMLHAELDEIRRRQETIRDEIRTRSPRLGRLQYPHPLSLDKASAALDPGTVMLAYSVGEQGGTIFILGPDAGAFRAHPLKADRDSLGAKVLALRRAIVGRRPVAPAADSLSRILLEPATDEIARAERILVSPDGSLHLVPFGALTDPRPPDGKRRYLIEARPVHSVLSATVYAELRDGPDASGVPFLAAFGDPVYSPEKHAAPAETGDLPTLAARGDFKDLRFPHTRVEIDGISRHFPGRNRVLLAEDATEEQAKHLPKEATVIHFACHAKADGRFPLDSYLALTLPPDPKPGQDNGLLQAWEIFESVRLDADLVVLSACETALGKETAGEGIIGLTRAFQYAGAESVVASLWSVADASTAALMERFYAHLSEGLAKDEALRRAQIDLLNGPVRVTDPDGTERDFDATHPFFWAPFQLTGDWK